VTTANEDEESPRGFDASAPRPFSWRVVFALAVDLASDIADDVSGSLALFRSHLVAGVKWDDENNRIFREIEALPTVPAGT
jgi:hypothetical protein